MRETVTCPQCRRSLELPSEYLGQEVQCPQCAFAFVAGASRPAPPPSAAPAESIEPSPPTPRMELPDDDLPPPREKRPGRRARLPASARVPNTPSRGRAAVILSVVVCAVGCGLCWVFNIGTRNIDRPIDFANVRQPQFEPPQMLQQLQQKNEDPGLPAVNDDPPKEQMAAFFKRFTSLVRDRNQPALGGCFDFSDLVDKLAQQGLIAGGAPNRVQVVMQWNHDFAGDILKDNTYSRGDVRHVRRVNEHELIAITRHQLAPGEQLRVRWWFANRGGVWKVTDMENLDEALRVSAMTTARQPGAVNQGDILRVREAFEALTIQKNLDESERLLKLVRVANLPGPVAGAFHQLHAILHYRKFRHQECLAACDEAHRAHPDLPFLEFLRAVSFNYLKKFDVALAHARKAQEQMGDDALLFHEMGLALAEQGQFANAAGYYRKSLDEEPTYHVTFLSLLRCMGPDVDRGDIGARFLKLNHPQDHFGTCARDVWSAFDAKTLEPLAEAMLKLEPRNPEASYYLALAQAEQSRLPQAVAAFKSALEFQRGDERRRDYYREFAKVLAVHDNVLKAYPDMPDAAVAFPALASALREYGKTEDVRELSRLHAVKHPDDPAVQLHHADALVAEEKYAEADKAYTAAYARVKDEKLLASHRPSFVIARYRMGDVIGAYRDIPPRSATFDQLANLCWTDKKGAELAALVAAHRKNDAGDRQLPRQDWRVSILLANMAEAGRIAKTAWNASGNDAQRINEDFVYDLIDTDHLLDAYRLAPDQTRAFEILSQELQDIRLPKELQAVIEERRKDVPNDPMLSMLEASQAHDAQEWQKAAHGFRAGWPQLPADKRQRWTYSYLYSSYKAGEAMLTYPDVRTERDGFRLLAVIMLQDKDTDAFEKLIETRRLEKPGNFEFDAFDARLQLLKGKPENSKALLAQAWQKAPEFERRRLIEDFVSDLANVERGLDAYRCAPDKMLAFQPLLWRMRDKKRIAEFETLLEEHAKYHPTDPRLIIERGELCLLKDDAPQAERRFVEAKQKAAPADTYRVRTGLMRARIRLGKVVETYQEFGASQQNFQDLAYQCVAEKNAEQMQILLAAHRKAMPAARNLDAWDVEVLWLKKDYAATAKAILDRRIALLGAASQARWKCEGYLIRSLVRSGKFKDARHEAEVMNQKKNGPQMLLILALAADGDVQGVTAQLEKARDRRFLVEDCYRDEDLGPLLRGDTFRAFRKRFPEPPKK